MKRLLLSFTLAIALVLIFPISVVKADSTKPDPTYYLEWTIPDEYDGETFSFEFHAPTITFSSDKIINPSPSYRFLMIDGTLIPDAEIIIRNDRTLVPARIVSEGLGATVDWDSETQRVTIEKDSIELIMTIDSTNISINGQNATLEVPATLIGDVTYVPLRVITDSLGAEVGYYDKEPFALYPVIWIESENASSQPMLSRDESVEHVKEVFMDALNKWLARYETDDYFVRDMIANKTCIGEFARYWVFDDALVDKYTGAIYYFRGAYSSFWIDEFDVDDYDYSIGALYFAG